MLQAQYGSEPGFEAPESNFFGTLSIADELQASQTSPQIVSRESVWLNMFRCIAVNKGIFVQSEHSGRKLTFSGKEKRQILASWANVTDKEEFGHLVFVKIFERKPALKTHWILEDRPLAANPKFRQHAKGFAMFLDNGMRSLREDEGEFLVPMVRKVGEDHCRRKGVSFDAENWLLYKNSVLDVMDLNGASSARNLWNLFLTFVIGEMKDAFCKEVSRMHSRPSQTVNIPEDQSLLKKLLDKERNSED